MVAAAVVLSQGVCSSFPLPSFFSLSFPVLLCHSPSCVVHRDPLCSVTLSSLPSSPVMIMKNDRSAVVSLLSFLLSSWVHALPFPVNVSCSCSCLPLPLLSAACLSADRETRVCDCSCSSISVGASVSRDVSLTDRPATDSESD